LAIRLTLRFKLVAIVATAALAFGVLIVASTLISNRVEQHLTRVRKVHVPKIELGAKLESHFGRISRGLQDAAAAADADALVATRAHKEKFLEQLAAAGDAVDPADAAALRDAMEEYYALAEEVAGRIIGGEKGELLMEAIASMQARQRRAGELLGRATLVDREELTEVFASTARIQATATRIRLFVTLACLFLVMLLSLWLGRGVLRSLAGIAAGFERFGRGDFDVPIAVASHDELGDVAHRANQMARDLKRLAEERERMFRDLDASRRDLAEALEATRNTLAELEAFSYSVSHDLRAPLRGIDGFSQALLEDYSDKLGEEGKQHLVRVRAGAQRMGLLIDDLLKLSRVNRGELRHAKVDLSRMAREVIADLRQPEADRQVEVVIEEELTADGDPQLLKVAMENLLGNAWKFTSRRSQARIEFGKSEVNGCSTFFVRDNGAGFDMTYAHKLFGAFQRLHSMAEFPGTGIGLATVQRVIRRHGGRVWAEGAVGQGAAFFFTLSQKGRSHADG
jgi:signal transduction histidine kinase